VAVLVGIAAGVSLGLAELPLFLMTSITAMVVFRAVVVPGGFWISSAWPPVHFLLGLFLIALGIRTGVPAGQASQPVPPPFPWLARWWRAGEDPADGALWARETGGWALTRAGRAFVLGVLWSGVYALGSGGGAVTLTGDRFLAVLAVLGSLLGLRPLFYVMTVFGPRLRFVRLGAALMVAAAGLQETLPRAWSLAYDRMFQVLAALLSIMVLVSLTGWNRTVVSVVSPLARDLEKAMTWSYTGLRRLLVILMGITVLLVGIVMIVTPGPAVLVIPLGLAILASEFAWARWLLKNFRQKAQTLSDKVKQLPRPW